MYIYQKSYTVGASKKNKIYTKEGDWFTMYLYLYLSLIPSLVTIAFFIFNENAQKNYNTKKAVTNLCTFIALITFNLSWRIIDAIYIFPKTSTLNRPLWFFIFMFVAGIIAPIITLNRSKLNRKEDILDKKWFQIVFAVIIIVFMVFMPGILMALKFKS